MRTCNVLLRLGLFFTFISTQAQSFGNFGTSYWRWVEEGQVEAYPLPEALQTTAAPRTLPSTPEAKRLLTIYEPLVNDSVNRWEVIELPPALKIGSSQPVDPYFNTHILKAFHDTKFLAAFRPVHTTTGCRSGCTPVMFHLQLDASGKTTALIEDPDKPLRKIWHEPFTQEDKALALALAQKLPKILQELSGATDLTDNSVFPPQTLTAYSEFTVPGAAYTSYRIYEAALKSATFLSNEFRESEISTERKTIIDALRISPRQATKTIERLLKVIKVKGDVLPRRAAIHLVPKLWAWKASIDKKPREALKLAQTIFNLSEFRGTHFREYCDARALLMDTSQGRHMLLEMNKTPKKWPSCGADATQGLLILAAVLEKVKDKDFKKISSNWDFAQTPPLFQNGPELLEAYAKAAGRAKNEEQSHRIAAELHTRFPGFATSLPTSSAEDLKVAEDEYRTSLHRLVLKERFDFPELIGVQRSSKLILPLSQKQIYVFFASWCPHCRDTLMKLGQSNLPKDVASKVQLVEVFIRENSLDGTEVCTQSNLPKTLCSDLVKVPPSVSAERSFSKMNLFSVPRVFMVDTLKRISVLDYELDFRDGRDPLRDLRWLLDEVNK